MNRPNAIVLPTLGALACLLGLLLMVRNGNSAAEKKPAAAPAQRERVVSGLTTSEEEERLLSDPALPFREIYRALARRRPDEITELARKLQDLPRGPATTARIASFFKAWATLDASRAFAQAKSLPQRLRTAALEGVLEGADPTVAGALVASLNELPEGVVAATQKSALLAQGVSKWSRVDPPAAARFLETTGAAGLGFSMAWHDVAANWAALDPAAAIVWAKEKKRPGPDFALSGAVLGWWENDPRAAEAYVQSHLGTLEDWQLASTLASNMFRDDPARALEWVRQLPNEDARRQANSSIAISWSFDEPALAAKWASTLPVAEQPDALASVMDVWSRNDPQTAAEWLGEYDGPGRDRAVQGFSFNVGDPAAALTWAATISDPKIRASAQERLARDWLKTNPQAATTWIQNSSLSADEKAHFLNPEPGP